MKRWEELLDGVPWEACTGRFQAPDPSLAVHGLNQDSRQVRPGDLFIAIQGTAADGNRFAAQAERAGAVAVVTDVPDQLPPLGIPVARVPDARLALSRVAARFYGNPSQRLKVVGITGTLGKTSVTELAASILSQAGPDYVPGVVGSLGIRFRDQSRGSLLTTPDALTLQRALAEMADAGVKVALMEVTSHAQLQQRVADVSFAVACLLNLVPGEHGEVHPTFDHYTAVKLRILDQVHPDGLFLFSSDDPEVGRRVVPRLKQLPYRTAAFGHGPRRRSHAAPVPALYLKAGEPGSLLLTVSDAFPSLAGPLPAAELQIPWHLYGEQNRQNATAAAAVALALGVGAPAIQRGLAAARPARRRMEPIYEGPFRVLDDTTGHPASFEALFRSLEALPRAGIVLLTAVRGSRGEAVNRANARTIARWAAQLPIRSVVVTASSEAVHPKDAVQPGEWQAFRKELVRAGIPAAYHLELHAAVEAALDAARPGDILVLAGAQGLDRAASILRPLLARRAALPGSS